MAFNNYYEMQNDNEKKLASKLNHVDSTLEVLDFISRFQNLSSVNWKWVFVQNPDAKILLTENVIKKNGFKINIGATKTSIFVPIKVDGKIKFEEQTRYDISQTNAKISDFPHRKRDYESDVNKEVLESYFGSEENILNFIDNQVKEKFASRTDLDSQLKMLHTQLTSHIVKKHFGIKTNVTPYAQKWMDMKQTEKGKINVIDSVHSASQKIIKEIEKELDFTHIKYEKVNGTNQTVHSKSEPLNKASSEASIDKEKTVPTFDKLKKDLRIDDSSQQPDKSVANEDQYKETQGVYNFINFLDKLEEQYPTLVKSQSRRKREIGSGGAMYEVLLDASYTLGDLRFEFDGNDNAIKVHGRGKHIRFDVLDGTLPEVFINFKEQVLSEIDKSHPEENKKIAESNPPHRISKKRLTDKEINTADGINIVQFIKQNGIDLKSVGRGRYHSEEYSSLVVLASSNKFYYNANGASGGPIKFAQEMLGIKHFVDAVNYINSGEYDQANSVEIKKESYVFDQNKQSTDFSKAYDYLTGERKIDAGVVNGLHHSKGLIYQDIYGNVLFPFLENGKIVGCSERRTVSKDGFPNQKTQLASAVNRGWNFLNGEPKNLKFFEDPVDVLSYMTLHKDQLRSELKDTWFISLHGSATKQGVVHHYMSEAMNYYVKDVVKNVFESIDLPFDLAEKIFNEKGMSVESLQEIFETAGIGVGMGGGILKVAGKRIESISMCTDNDKGGWEIANGFKKVFASQTPESYFYHTEYRIEIPGNKDWNDELKSQIDMLEIKQEKQTSDDDFVEIEVLNDDYIPVDLVNYDSCEGITQSRSTQMSMEL